MQITICDAPDSASLCDCLGCRFLRLRDENRYLRMEKRIPKTEIHITIEDGRILAHAHTFTEDDMRHDSQDQDITPDQRQIGGSPT